MFAFAHAEVNVVGSGTRILRLEPGQSIEERLVLRNTGSTAVDVTVYLGDYWFEADGGPRFDPPGSHARSNTGWFEVVGPGWYHLPAGGEVTMELRGAVPEDLSLVGSYWSTLLVEERGAAGPNDGPAHGVGLRIVHRRVVQVITELDGGSADLRFQAPAFDRDEATGALRLRLDLHNVGTAQSFPTTRLEVLDAAGSLVLAADGRRARVYPGTSVRQTFDLAALAPGLYDVLVLADGGNLDVFGVRYTLDLREGD